MSAEPTRSPRLAAGAAAAAALALSGATILLVWRSLFPPGANPRFADIEWYQRALDHVAAGRPMYEQLTYPPITLVLLAPLRGLPDLAGKQLWAGATLAVAVLLAVVTVRFTMPEADRGRLVGRPEFLIKLAIAIPMVVLSYPVIFHLTAGQLSIFVMALAFLDASGVLARRYQGSLVGAASALKLTPLLFLPYYAVTRQWRQLGTAVGAFVLMGVIGFGLFPADSAYFWTHPDSSGQIGVDSFLNTTVLGSLVSWFGATPTVRVVWLILAVVVGVAALRAARNHFRRGEMLQAALVVGVASTLVGPIGWPHYDLWQVLAAIWMLLGGRRRTLAAGLALYALYSLPVALFLYGPDQATLAARLARLAPVLASTAICVLGLPGSRPAPVAVSPATAIMES